jgi:hypothetical protein
LDTRLTAIEEFLSRLAVNYPGVMGNELWLDWRDGGKNGSDTSMEVNDEKVNLEIINGIQPEAMFIEGDVSEILGDLERAKKMQNCCKEKYIHM